MVFPDIFLSYFSMLCSMWFLEDDPFEWHCKEAILLKKVGLHPRNSGSGVSAALGGFAEQRLDSANRFHFDKDRHVIQQVDC